MSESDLKRDWLKSLHSTLKKLPDDYLLAYAELTEFRHQFQKELANALQGRLNSHLATLPQDTFADKQKIVSDVNRDLRLLNLCLRHPATGLPAILTADFRNDQEKNSRFRLLISDPSGRPLRKDASARLPHLELQEAPPREEHFARQRRTGRTTNDR